MPKLYFDFDRDGSRFVDQEGFDLPDLEAGRDEVLRTLGELSKSAFPKSDHQVLAAFVRDKSGNVVYSARVTVSGTWHER
ncbi:DUF6894 family protein [Methylobacterium sp. Leaf113]|uniref:DUF6894 family protein n=1 Tax=Methylobacterium sp. Leaf113 TaxID=1736259 RepID=UPI000B2BD4BD